ncbi:MAG TPA: MFS transporter, partial [Streptosporangiaceae bacterium]
RVGAYLMMLGVGTAISGVFFFLTLFVQDVWGYSALRTGMAFLPVTAAMFVGAIGASALVPRIGARPLLVGGSVVTVGGLYWLSRMTEHGSYAGDLLGAGLVLGIGFGLLIVPLQLLSLTRVGEADSGVAASLLNAGRQVGGAIGLAVLGTVAWTVVADNARSHASGAASAVGAAYQHALVVGFDRAFLVGAGIAVLILLTALTTIRIRRADLAGS